MGKRVLVICHSVVVLCFRRLLEKWDEEQYLQVDRENDVKNCSVTHYQFDEIKHKLLLREYNTTYYPQETESEKSIVNSNS